MNNNNDLPEGCRLVPLNPIEDDRGILIETYRQEWVEETARVQWNLVRSKPGTLRGVHLHAKRTDYLVVIEGEMWLGLYDMRRASETFGRSYLVRLAPDENQAAYLATGVAHGFYFTKPSLTLYGLSDYWTMDDEFGCHPDDPGLGIVWPGEARILSARDQAASDLSEMQTLYDQWQQEETACRSA